jgi:hypothetical protein
LTRPVFRILGPLEIELNGHVAALGRRERALLGVLLLNAGEVVSVECLIEGVWGDAPPTSAKHMLHEYVSRLRQTLGDASRIVTCVPGYVAVCGDEELDARRFAALAATARAAARAREHAEALQSYDEALQLWRGGALAGVELEGDARIDAARLDQERLMLKEERIDTALALGRHRELIPELERLVRRHLPALVRAAGWTVVRLRSYGYAETDEPGYMLTIVDRGADALVALGRLDAQTADALKGEARRRAEGGVFFGHIAYACLTAEAR